MPDLLVRDRTVANLILKLTFSHLPTSSWNDIITRLLNLQPNNQFLLRLATDYCLNRLASQCTCLGLHLLIYAALSTKNKLTLESLIDALVQRHPLSSEPAISAQARTTAINSKSIQHQLRFARSLLAISVKRAQGQTAGVDQRLMLIAFSLLSTSSKDGGATEMATNDLALLLDYCLKSIEAHPTNKQLWKLLGTSFCFLVMYLNIFLGYLKQTMVSKGFGTVTPTVTSSFIPLQKVSAIDVNQIAASRGISCTALFLGGPLNPFSDLISKN